MIRQIKRYETRMLWKKELQKRKKLAYEVAAGELHKLRFKRGTLKQGDPYKLSLSVIHEALRMGKIGRHKKGSELAAWLIPARLAKRKKKRLLSRASRKVNR